MDWTASSHRHLPSWTSHRRLGRLALNRAARGRQLDRTQVLGSTWRVYYTVCCSGAPLAVSFPSLTGRHSPLQSPSTGRSNSSCPAGGPALHSCLIAGVVLYAPVRGSSHPGAASSASRALGGPAVQRYFYHSGFPANRRPVGFPLQPSPTSLSASSILTAASQRDHDEHHGP
jgi:hypothetical protein